MNKQEIQPKQEENEKNKKKNVNPLSKKGVTNNKKIESCTEKNENINTRRSRKIKMKAGEEGVLTVSTCSWWCFGSDDTKEKLYTERKNRPNNNDVNPPLSLSLVLSADVINFVWLVSNLDTVNLACKYC